MDKKSVIINILAGIESYWSDAWKLKEYIANNNIDEKTLDVIIIAINTAIKDTENDIAKEKLNQGLNTVRSLKAKEAAERNKEQGDINKIEKMFDNI